MDDGRKKPKLCPNASLNFLNFIDGRAWIDGHITFANALRRKRAIVPVLEIKSENSDKDVIIDVESNDQPENILDILPLAQPVRVQIKTVRVRTRPVCPECKRIWRYKNIILDREIIRSLLLPGASGLTSTGILRSFFVFHL